MTLRWTAVIVAVVALSAVPVTFAAPPSASPTANQHLAETRSQVVVDELARDGLDRATFRQVLIGQTGSGDPSVAERRVDIVLER
jgi:outer membrane protein OmpA-like peptidoglycan-associated protein